MAFSFLKNKNEKSAFWSQRFLPIALTPLALSSLLLGCSSSSQDQIYDAQACLDKATQSTAMTCYAQVNSLTSTSAYLIRCASILVYEGFGSASFLQTAATALQGSSAGAAAASLAFLADKGGNAYSSTIDENNAENAATQCASSGSSGLSMLASLSSVATIASAIVTTAPSLASINAQAGAIVAASPQVATLLVTTYQQNCTGSVSSADQSFCTQYATAAAANPSSASAAAIAFLQNLK